MFFLGLIPNSPLIPFHLNSYQTPGHFGPNLLDQSYCDIGIEKKSNEEIIKKIMFVVFAVYFKYSNS